MAKLKDLAELPPVNDPTQTTPLTASERREEKDILVQEKDIELIDKIILSDDMQKGGIIRIERRGPLEQNWSFVCKLPAEQWGDTNDRIEWCKNMFGGGEYNCRTFRANGQMYKSFAFAIDPRYQGKLDKDEIQRLNDRTDKGDGLTKILESMAPKPGDGLRVSDMLNMMDRQNNKGEQAMAMMMTMMVKSMEVSAQQNMGMMTALATMFAGKSNGSDNQAILLELIKQKQERTPMTETLEMMKSVKEIFGDGNKDEEKDDMWSKIGRIAGPVLTGIMAGGQPKAGPTPTPTAGQPAPPPRQIPAGMVYQLPPQYQVMLKLGLSAAERGSDPALYYDLLVDNMGDDGIKMLQQALTGDDWCAKMFGDEAQVAHIRPWLDELRSLIITHVTNPVISESPASGESATVGQPPV